MKVAEKTLGVLTNLIDEERSAWCHLASSQAKIPAKGLLDEREVIDEFVDLVNCHKRFVLQIRGRR